MRRIGMAIALGLMGVWSWGAQTTLADTSSVTRSPTVSFRLASSSATGEYDRVAFDGQTLFVARESTFTDKDVISATSSRTGSGLSVQVTSRVALNLVTATRSAADDRLVVFVSGRIVAAPKIDSVNTNGALTLTELSATESQRLVRLLSGGTAYTGPVIGVETSRAAASPGDVFTIEVYVKNVQDVGAFQVMLSSQGGESGKLIIEDVVIEERPDSVFDSSAVTATSMARFQAMGVHVQGAEAMEQRYLATYTVRVSPDARGAFELNVAPGGDDATLLRTSDGFGIAFRRGTAATIQVGSSVTRKDIGR